MSCYPTLSYRKACPPNASASAISGLASFGEKLEPFLRPALSQEKTHGG